MPSRHYPYVTGFLQAVTIETIWKPETFDVYTLLLRPGLRGNDGS